MGDVKLGRGKGAMGLTPCERVMAAIGLKEPDRVPMIPRTKGFCIAHAGLTMRECFEKPERYVDAQLRMVEDFAFDAVTDIHGGVSIFSECLGKELTFGKGGPPTAEPVFTSPDLGTTKQISLGGHRRTDDLRATVKKLKEAVGNDYPVVVSVPTPFRAAALLRGVQEFYHDLLRHQLFVNDLLDICLDACKTYADIVIDAGADIVFTSTSVASRDCISKALYKKLVTEGHKELHAVIRARKKPIMHHTCGDWSDRFDLVVEEGADVLFVAAEADMSALKETYGRRVCLMGNVDSVRIMLLGTPEDVEERCLRSLKNAGSGGGFILSNDCELPPQTPVENLRALERAGLQYGAYPLVV